MGINVCTLSGNVGNPPDIKYLDSGTVIASFSLAVQGWDGKKKEKKTLWFACKAFNKTAEAVGEYIKSGSPITVSGKLDTEEWESEGQLKSKMVLIIQDIQLPPKPAN